ncbi:MAG: 8-amino-7-oxononanoate synthase [Caulobacter sp.]|nr:8-amino-7-oxononanoate synthase [Caulobacter sp.]
MTSLDAFAGDKLNQLEAASLLRRLKPTRRLPGGWVERDGRRLLSFSDNDYLGLSHHPAVIAAAQAATAEHGAGAGASRLVTGDNPLFSALEERLARLKGTEAACLFGSGYLANTGVIPTFAGPKDIVLVDQLAHACIWAGAQLSGARIIPFRHNDVAHLAELLAEHRASARHALVATDGVFSMDGDVAPLGALSDLCAAHDAWLLSDDAHGVGVLAHGKGSAALFPGAVIPLQMGTLSKALGAYGGYLCGSKAVVDLLKTRARTVVYTTGLPPGAAAAALAALDVIEADPDMAALPLAKARAFTQAVGLPPATSPIVPVIIGEAQAALDASRALEAEGFLVVAIRPPTVPVGAARLRIAFSAQHPDAEIARLAALVRPFVKVTA